MPPRKAAVKKSPVRRNADKERIAELENELKEQKKTSKNFTNDVGDYQYEIRYNPYQRLALYIFIIINVAFGLGLIIYAATHSDMDTAITTRDNLYVAGGILVTFGVSTFLIDRMWLKTISSIPGMRKINATTFELNVAKNTF